MTDKIDFDELLPPTHFVLIGDILYYDSPTRGRIKVVEVEILPNYDDVELVQFRTGDDINIIMRKIGSNYGEEKLKDIGPVVRCRPHGDVVTFLLEDGRSLHMDLGSDPEGGLKRLLQEILKRWKTKPRRG